MSEDCCTWHGIKGYTVHYVHELDLYYLMHNGERITENLPLDEACHRYAELAWNEKTWNELTSSIP